MVPHCCFIVNQYQAAETSPAMKELNLIEMPEEMPLAFRPLSFTCDYISWLINH
jgi:hypothetical protein